MSRRRNYGNGLTTSEWHDVDQAEEGRKHGGHVVVLRAFERGETAVAGRTMIVVGVVVGHVVGSLVVSVKGIVVGNMREVEDEVGKEVLGVLEGGENLNLGFLADSFFITHTSII